MNHLGSGSAALCRRLETLPSSPSSPQSFSAYEHPSFIYPRQIQNHQHNCRPEWEDMSDLKELHAGPIKMSSIHCSQRSFCWLVSGEAFKTVRAASHVDSMQGHRNDMLSPKQGRQFLAGRIGLSRAHARVRGRARIHIHVTTPVWGSSAIQHFPRNHYPPIRHMWGGLHCIVVIVLFAQ